MTDGEEGEVHPTADPIQDHLQNQWDIIEGETEAATITGEETMEEDWDRGQDLQEDMTDTAVEDIVDQDHYLVINTIETIEDVEE